MSPEIQPSLFGADNTIPSPLCIYEHCERKGRVVLGSPVMASPDCENREMVCQTCGRTGVQSRNLSVRGEMGTA